MDFKQTGLPFEASVYKAYMTYQQAQSLGGKPAPAGEAGGNDAFPVKVAQTLHEADESSPDILSAALLLMMPKSTYGMLETRVGKPAVDLIAEAARHVQTGYAYIEDASDDLKKICLASAIVSFGEFKRGMAMLGPVLQKLESGEPVDNLPILKTPPTDMYDRFTKAAVGKIGNPALEELYLDKLEEFKEESRVYNERLEEMGIFVNGAPGARPRPSAIYPTFAETGLLDDPKVRTAYDIVINDPRLRPENFMAALETAKLLSDLPASKNPAAIAYALIDIGVQGLNTFDLELLKPRLDWDVLELLTAGSIYDLTLTPDRIMKMPVEFRQVFLAHAATVAANALDGGIDAVQRAKGLPPEFVTQQLVPVQMVYLDLRKTAMGIFGTADAPELEAELEQRMDLLKKFLYANAPKPAAPKSAPPKKPDAPKPPEA